MTRRVLVVDDNPDIRFLVSLQLQLEGYEVLQAADGAEAIAITQHWQPDGIVLDLRMPVMGGEEALPHLRNAAPRTAVVVFSAEPSHKMLRGLLDQGADAVVGKSEPPDLLRCVLATTMAARTGDSGSAA